jgi:hypothetical protein
MRASIDAPLCAANTCRTSAASGSVAGGARPSAVAIEAGQRDQDLGDIAGLDRVDKLADDGARQRPAVRDRRRPDRNPVVDGHPRDRMFELDRPLDPSGAPSATPRCAPRST